MKDIKVYKISKAKVDDVDFVKLAKLQRLEHALRYAKEDLLYWKKIMEMDMYESEENQINKLMKQIIDIYNNISLSEYYNHKVYNIFEIPGDGSEDMIGVEITT